jgi:uncharacterized membrane protein
MIRMLTTPGRARALAAVLIGAVAAGIILARLPEPLLAISGALLALLLPGYVWTLPYVRDEWSRLARPAFALAASVGMSIVLGLLLDIVPGGLTRQSWSLGLEILICVGAIVVCLRRAPEPATGDRRFLSFRLRIERSLIVGAQAITLLAMLGVAAWLTLSSQHHTNTSALERFTSLAIRGGGASGPDVRVMNHDQKDGRYVLVADVGGRTVSSANIRVGSNETLRLHLKVPAPSLTSTAVLSVTLKRRGEDGAMRKVWLGAHDGQWR